MAQPDFTFYCVPNSDTAPAIRYFNGLSDGFGIAIAIGSLDGKLSASASSSARSSWLSQAGVITGGGDKSSGHDIGRLTITLLPFERKRRRSFCMHRRIADNDPYRDVHTRPRRRCTPLRTACTWPLHEHYFLTSDLLRHGISERSPCHWRDSLPLL